MHKHRKILSLSTAMVLATTVAGSALPLPAATRANPVVQDLGPANLAQVISIDVHLKSPNQTLLRTTVDALYDPQSSAFHHWLSDAQLRAFGPSVAEIATVRAELARNGLSIASISADGFSIRATGTIAAVERAFQTPIHVYVRNGREFRANTRPATLTGAAGAYVSVVSGLQSHQVRPMLVHAIDPATKRPFASIPLSRVMAAGGLSSIVTDRILGPKQTFTFSTSGALPTASYTGLVYDPDATRTADFAPKQLQQAYGLPAAYAKGLDGTGQTIVLLEAFGYPTALADANAYSKLAGLPALNASNFRIVYPEGVPNPQAGILTGWDTEIAMDIQSAHAIAPGAKIVLVATNGQDDIDFDASIRYITDNRLGYTVSDSWEEDTDLLAGPAEQEVFEDDLVAAAAKGISFQFSSGDGGDGGLGTPVGAAGVPAVEPHATAVGGTSIVNVPGTSSFVPLGWGDDLNFVALNNAPLDPPTAEVEYFGGAGGGSSVFWPKPSWQRSLPGYYRQIPDVSALADPYTGFPVLLTTAQGQVVQPGWGGTSLASPIFTAIWAIAQQRAGHPLGQAAPTVARLKTGVQDVLPLSSSVFAASVKDSSGTTDYTALALFANLGFSQRVFLPTVWNLPQYGEAVVLAFGADSSLTVTSGWDNVTGFGTPAGLAFIEAAAR